MKRVMLTLAALCMLAAAGCASNLTHGCNHCGPGGHAGHGGHGGHGAHGGRHAATRAQRQADHVARMPHGYYRTQQMGPAGPAAPSVAYPYYTTRGPRDFLVDEPSTIGR